MAFNNHILKSTIKHVLSVKISPPQQSPNHDHKKQACQIVSNPRYSTPPVGKGPHPVQVMPTLCNYRGGYFINRVGLELQVKLFHFADKSFTGCQLLAWKLPVAEWHLGKVANWHIQHVWPYPQRKTPQIPLHSEINFGHSYILYMLLCYFDCKLWHSIKYCLFYLITFLVVRWFQKFLNRYPLKLA